MINEAELVNTYKQIVGFLERNFDMENIGETDKVSVFQGEDGIHFVEIIISDYGLEDSHMSRGEWENIFLEWFAENPQTTTDAVFADVASYRPYGGGTGFLRVERNVL